MSAAENLLWHINGHFMFYVFDGVDVLDDGVVVGLHVCFTMSSFGYGWECNVKTIIPFSSEPHGNINKHHITPHTHLLLANTFIFIHLEKKLNIVKQMGMNIFISVQLQPFSFLFGTSNK